MLAEKLPIFQSPSRRRPLYKNGYFWTVVVLLVWAYTIFACKCAWPSSILALRDARAYFFSVLKPSDLLHITAASDAASGDGPPTAPSARPKTANLELRILPLGDSITYGEGGTTGNGYRLPLYTSLTAAGHNVTMVGSRTQGSMVQNALEAWPGVDVQYVSYAANFSLWRRPNVVLLHTGSNDLRYYTENRHYFDQTAHRVGKLIDQILAACPDAVLFVAKPIKTLNHGMLHESARLYNAGLETEVKQRAAEGKRVVLVDATKILDDADLFDVAHPNDAGYDKLAALWHKHITSIIRAGFLADPQPEPAEAPPEALKPFPPMKVNIWEDDEDWKAANAAATVSPSFPDSATSAPVMPFAAAVGGPAVESSMAAALFPTPTPSPFAFGGAIGGAAAAMMASTDAFGAGGLGVSTTKR